MSSKIIVTFKDNTPSAVIDQAITNLEKAGGKVRRREG